MTYKWEAMVEDLTVERDRLRKALEGIIDYAGVFYGITETGRRIHREKMAIARKALNEKTE